MVPEMSNMVVALESDSSHHGMRCPPRKYASMPRAARRSTTTPMTIMRTQYPPRIAMSIAASLTLPPHHGCELDHVTVGTERHVRIRRRDFGVVEVVRVAD